MTAPVATADVAAHVVAAIAQELECAAIEVVPGARLDDLGADDIGRTCIFCAVIDAFNLGDELLASDAEHEWVTVADVVAYFERVVNDRHPGEVAP